jgi:hypothetical protein
MFPRELSKKGELTGARKYWRDSRHRWHRHESTGPTVSEAATATAANADTTALRGNYSNTASEMDSRLAPLAAPAVNSPILNQCCRHRPQSKDFLNRFLPFSLLMIVSVMLSDDVVMASSDGSSQQLARTELHAVARPVGGNGLGSEAVAWYQERFRRSGECHALRPLHSQRGSTTTTSNHSLSLEDNLVLSPIIVQGRLISRNDSIAYLPLYCG